MPRYNSGMTPEDSSDQPKHVIYTRYEKTCLECGTPFVSKRVDARFCGGTCHRRRYDRENLDKVRERRRRYEEAHKEEQRARARAHYEQHGEEVRSANRQRRILASPEQVADLQEKKRQWYQENRDRILEKVKDKRQLERSYRKLSAHGVDYEVLFAALWEAQGGNCYLCGDPLLHDQPREVHLDHDHRCCPLNKSCERCRRGLACRRCNYLIGLAKDDPDCLRRIADGIEEANKAVSERMQQPRQERAGTSREMACSYCSTPFTAFRSDALYCSTLCANRASEERRGLRKPGARPVIATIPCEQCGELFDKRNGNALYCSDRCRRVVKRQQNKATKARWVARKASGLAPRSP
jgi:Recombination endonuclease VII